MLSELEVNETGTICGIRSHRLRVRLIEVGLIVGSRVTVIHKAPLQGPIAVQLKDFVIALRADEAQLIQISYEEEDKRKVSTQAMGHCL